jgi:hypothetical protein
MYFMTVSLRWRGTTRTAGSMTFGQRRFRQAAEKILEIGIVPAFCMALLLPPSGSALA